MERKKIVSPLFKFHRVSVSKTQTDLHTEKGKKKFSCRLLVRTAK